MVAKMGHGSRDPWRFFLFTVVRLLWAGALRSTVVVELVSTVASMDEPAALDDGVAKAAAKAAKAAEKDKFEAEKAALARHARAAKP